MTSSRVAHVYVWHCTFESIYSGNYVTRVSRACKSTISVYTFSNVRKVTSHTHDIVAHLKMYVSIYIPLPHYIMCARCRAFENVYIFKNCIHFLKYIFKCATTSCVRDVTHDVVDLHVTIKHDVKQFGFPNCILFKGNNLIFALADEQLVLPFCKRALHFRIRDQHFRNTLTCPANTM